MELPITSKGFEEGWPSVERDRSGLALGFVVPLALALGVAAFFCVANRNFQFDDGLIYQRYVRNMLAGNGLVYNTGERFNGLTSPLYTLLSVGVALVVRDAQAATVIVASAAMLAAISAYAVLFARHGARYGTAAKYGAGAGACIAACHAYFYYTFGVETPLFVLLLAVAVLLFLERASAAWLGLALAFLVLTRPEGGFLALPMLYEHVREKRESPKLVHFVAPVALVGAVLLFNIGYYGSPLPATAAAKMGQGLSGYWGAWPAFAKIAYQVRWFFGGISLALGFCALAALGAFHLGNCALNRLTFGYLALLTLYYLSFNSPSYHWYYGPYYAFACFYAGTGAVWLIERVSARSGHGRLRHVRFALAALLLAWPLAAIKVTWANLGHPTNASYVSVGRWLAVNTPPGASVAAVEIGFVGWYSDRRIIDILGLVNPLNAEFVSRHDLHAWLAHYQPDYILMHNPGWSLEAGPDRAGRTGRYVVDERFAEPGFQLLRRP